VTSLRIGPLLADVVEAETEKFTVPVLLVHGRGESSSVWRPFSGYLAHLGWRCMAVCLREEADQLAEMREAINALETLPVLIGHDCGAVLALQSARDARAVIALAPLVPAAVLSSPSWWSPRRFWSRAPDPGQAAPQLEKIPEGTPCLVLAGEHDPVTPIQKAQALAARAGAEFQVFPETGHNLPNEPGWETRVATIHSWLVRKLGVELLALYEESVEDGESSANGAN